MRDWSINGELGRTGRSSVMEGRGGRRTVFGRLIKTEEDGHMMYLFE